MKMKKKWWILIVLLIIASLVSVSVVSNNNATTGHGILNKIGKIFGLGNDDEDGGNTVGVLRGEIVDQGVRLQVIKDQLTVTGIELPISAYGSAYGDETKTALLLADSCETGPVLASDEVDLTRAVFKNVNLERDQRYCIVVPGSLSGQYEFRYEFYNSNFLSTDLGKKTVCDPSPLSNEPYSCVDFESQCEFFGAEYYGSQIQCDRHATKLSNTKYLCSPNKFLDAGCYNQFDDCISGVEQVFDDNDGLKNKQQCQFAASTSNSDNWYLCYCLPTGLEWKEGADVTQEEKRVINAQASLLANKQALINNRFQELDVTQEYRCTQDVRDCLPSCPATVSLHARAYSTRGFPEDQTPGPYCGDEGESIYDQFPRGAVSVHDSQADCLAQTEFYECRG